MLQQARKKVKTWQHQHNTQQNRTMQLTQQQIEQAKVLFDKEYSEAKAKNPNLWTFLETDVDKGTLTIETSDQMSFARRLATSIEKALKLKKGTVAIVEKEYKTGADDWGGIYSAW